MDIVDALIMMGIPSAITCFCFWMIEHNIQKMDEKEKAERSKRQKKVDEREETRTKNEIYTLRTVQAALALGEATARAVQRIPDAKCNGDMHAALDYAEKVKHEQKDFLNAEAMKNMYQ